MQLRKFADDYNDEEEIVKPESQIKAEFECEFV